MVPLSEPWKANQVHDSEIRKRDMLLNKTMILEGFDTQADLGFLCNLRFSIKKKTRVKNQLSSSRIKVVTAVIGLLSK